MNQPADIEIPENPQSTPVTTGLASRLPHAGVTPPGSPTAASSTVASPSTQRLTGDHTNGHSSATSLDTASSTAPPSCHVAKKHVPLTGAVQANVRQNKMNANTDRINKLLASNPTAGPQAKSAEIGEDKGIDETLDIGKESVTKVSSPNAHDTAPSPELPTVAVRIPTEPLEAPLTQKTANFIA